MRDQLVAIAIQQVPTLIDLIKKAYKKANPDAPALTEAEVFAAFNQAFISSLVKDDAWLAAHPE